MYADLYVPLCNEYSYIRIQSLLTLSHGKYVHMYVRIAGCRRYGCQTGTLSSLVGTLLQLKLPCRGLLENQFFIQKLNYVETKIFLILILST